MGVKLYNDGATVRVENLDGSVQNIGKIYEVTLSKDSLRLSIRSALSSVQFNYADVESPATSSAEDLRALIESWNETGVSFEIAQSNSDIAGQIITGTPFPTGDYRFTKNINTRYFSTQTSGTGAITHEPIYSAQKIAVGASSGDYALSSTFQVHPYFAGFPIEAEITTIAFNVETGLEKEICYGSRTFNSFTDGFDGLKLVARDSTHYFEIWNAGSKIYESDRDSWSDKLDGTGKSGLNLGDFSGFSVFAFQFLWLGGAGAQFIVYAYGKKIAALTVPWSFVKSTLIMKDPQHPIQAGIKSTGSAGFFYFICSAVKTFGTPTFESGDEFALKGTNGGITLAGAPNLTALIGWRLKSTFRNTWVETVDLSILPEGNADAVRWLLLLNPTIAGTFNYSTDPGSEISVEYSIGTSANTVSDLGTIVAAGEVAGRNGLTGLLKAARKIGFALDGTADTMVLAVEPNSGGTIIVNPSVRLKQRY